MKKRLTLARYSILIALLLALTDVTALRINEVMYDPVGNDNNKEFIEIFNEEPMNLTGWVIADAESNDTLTEIKQVEYDEHNDQNQPYYALIVEEGFNATEINASIYTTGATIGNNLNNEQDDVRLYDANGTLVANMSYNRTTNTSLERYNDLYEESLVPDGTPGRKNSRENETIENETRENETIQTDQTSETGSETTLETIPELINISQNSTEDTDPCTTTFTIQTTKDIIHNKEQFMYQLVLDANATFEYWIEDLSGSIVRKKRTTHNAEPKSFTPTITEPEKVLVIKATGVTEECIFHAEKMIVVTNPNAQQKSAPKEKTGQKQEQRQEQKEKESEKRIFYASENIPETVILENNSAMVSFTLHLTNDDDDHLFEVWSYVFRGSKSYSGSRDENKQEFVLGAGQERRLLLSNTVTNLTPGTYALKVKIRKDNQASTTDITEKIIFEALPEHKTDRNIAPEIKTLISPQSVKTPAARVVQRQNPLPTILGALVVGVLIVFIWVKT